MYVRNKSKQLLIIGIIGFILYVTGDFLFAATDKGQSTESIGFMVRAANITGTVAWAYVHAMFMNVSAFFSLEKEKELESWSDHFAAVTAKSCMRGWRDIYKDVGLFHKLMIRFCDSLVKMKIVKIIFGA